MPNDCTAAKKVVDVPVSIDTLDPKKSMPQLRLRRFNLSADAGNLEKIAPFAKDIPVVIIHQINRKAISKKYKPKSSILEELITKPKHWALIKNIGDLILEPTNI
jgi:hypothetical protein